MLSKDTKAKLMKKYAQHDGDTGSTEVQIALLTANINEISNHIKTHKKDHVSARGLMKKIGHRRNLLRYLRNNNFKKYHNLTKSLGLRH
ncbi:30S ribosomal protein S15 [Acetilactobacillus jinshanensis]|uniref:Small ribosomal subunit protein uS15 n=1 Tax=Acetilactobacillus jinshanensis TaxID=1720083 RepID=A0A4V1ALK6_9LACO|nr:30S ribosomal protein S15 [Acetilactobacillus jinshanensis]QBP17929.1 30S ribosomal protein S15 [Acetilactobacillus jinshanensis]URL60792.1 30S ribosomal protein S15 [uncultured bacterium]